MTREKLMLPRPGNAFVEVPWPFTSFGKALDDFLRNESSNYLLIGKEYDDDDSPGAGFLWLRREYWNYFAETRYDTDVNITYERVLDIPCKREKNKNFRSMDSNAYGAFIAEDVTWFKGKPSVSKNALLECLSDSDVGKEQLTLDIGDELGTHLEILCSKAPGDKKQRDMSVKGFISTERKSDLPFLTNLFNINGAGLKPHPGSAVLELCQHMSYISEINFLQKMKELISYANRTS